MSDSKTFDSPVFCMMPWVHMHTWPSGKTFPCCMADSHMPIGDTSKHSLESIWNSKNMRKLRKNMMSGVESKECRRCYELESSGMRTLRNHSLEYFSHHSDLVDETLPNGSVAKVNLAYLDIRFSNICNLKCRSCGPELSSSWYKDHVKLHGNPGHPQILQVRKDMGHFWEELKPMLKNVEEVYFAGGEPLVTQEHYDLLDFWLDEGMTNVKIGYTTNFSQLSFKGRSALEMWKNFENVRVAASLDAEFSRGEFLRKNLRWEKVIENRRVMQRECPEIYFEITPTVSAYNVFTLPDFHRQWIEQGLVEPENLRINILLDPEYMRMQILPQELKKRCEEKIRSHMEWLSQLPSEKVGKVTADFANVIKFMYERDLSGLIKKWRIKTGAIDHIRGENVFDVFPELGTLANV